MNSENNNFNGLEKNIDKIDGFTAKNILNMVEMKNMSAWFNEELPSSLNKELDLQPEEALLTFEQVKELYPHWF